MNPPAGVSEWTVAFHELHRIRAILRFTSHAKVPGSRQNGLDPVAHDLVIIHQQNVDGHK